MILGFSISQESRLISGLKSYPQKFLVSKNANDTQLPYVNCLQFMDEKHQALALGNGEGQPLGIL